MRRILFVLPLLLVSACTGTSVNPRGFAPASLADIDQVRSEASEYAAKDAAAIDAVRADVNAAGVSTPKTDAAAADQKAHAEDVASRPTSGGVIGGALVNALGGSLPPWLDWCLTLLTGGAVTGTAVNRSRNKTRAAALAKVATAPKPPAAGAAS